MVIKRHYRYEQTQNCGYFLIFEQQDNIEHQIAIFYEQKRAEEFVQELNDQAEMEAWTENLPDMPLMSAAEADVLKYKNRSERLTKLISLKAPQLVVAAEAMLMLDAIYGDPTGTQTIQAILLWHTRYDNTKGTTKQ